MRQYYSSYVKEILNRYKKSIVMRIPRLGIIEVENIYNRNRLDDSPKGNLRKQDKQNFDNNQNKKAKERRKSLQTMSEIFSIKHDGGDILQHLDMTLLQSFTPLAGQDFADPWIRREITNNLGELRSDTIVNKDVHELTAEIFLTCDLMGALAAVAENINTMYFYRIENDSHKLKPMYDRLALLVVNIAIQLNECKCVISSPTKTITKSYQSFWSGKSGIDWENNVVLEVSA